MLNDFDLIYFINTLSEKRDKLSTRAQQLREKERYRRVSIKERKKRERKRKEERLTAKSLECGPNKSIEELRSYKEPHLSATKMLESSMSNENPIIPSPRTLNEQKNYLTI